MCDLLLAGVPSTLAGSKYVLFELPLTNKVFNVIDIIRKLKQNGYKPILAHPERYSYIQENPNELIEYIRAGVLIQSNYGSIVGRYGKDAEKTLGKLLENNMVHLLASDTHKRGFVYEEMPFIINELTRYTSKQTIKRLTNLNPKCIIQDEEFQIPVPTEIKKKKFFLFG
ncbi:MAG TPA: hypothetical protein DCZ30_05330 [Clostridiales bacterium]|nr:hypothetical protein [Clostridiales bacterium]